MPRLEATGARVTATDRELDVSDGPAVARALAEARPEAVVHLAAISSVPQSVARPHATWRVNYLGARSVLEGALRLERRPRVLLVGSAQIYGPGRPGAPPFDEEAPLRPSAPYAWSKAAADLLGGAYLRRGLDVVRVRPFNHTGPGRPDRFVESSFARQVAEIERGRRAPLIHVGNLDAVRDFLHVDDVVDAYVALLDRGAPVGVYNVASGVPCAIRELLDTLLAFSPARPEVHVDPERWRPPEASVGNAQRLMEATGWSPKRALADALRELLEEWRARLDGAAG